MSTTDALKVRSVPAIRNQEQTVFMLALAGLAIVLVIAGMALAPVSSSERVALDKQWIIGP